MNVKEIEILMVEDSPSDSELAVEAFKQSRVINNLTIIDNGGDAILYLKRQGKFADAILPDLILLDLNLPVKSGHEVLAEIKQDQLLKRIPVVVLTTSESEKDVLESYNLQASAFITKPVDFDKFISVVKDIQKFYFVVAKIPPNGTHHG
ncbi:MAG: response regulator [Candidatus Obscuribacterales bacterium]|jgi:CheY-like chemotaxis protein